MAQLQYVTLQDVKTYLNLSDTSQDAFVNLIIPKAMAFIDRYTHRTFGWGDPNNAPPANYYVPNNYVTAETNIWTPTVTDYKSITSDADYANGEMHDGIPGKTITLNYPDVVSIDQIVIGNKALAIQSVLQPNQYVWHPSGRVILGGAYFNSYDSTIYTDQGANDFFGTVAAGYQTITVLYHYGYTGVPDDIAFACLDVVAAMYILRKSLGIREEKIGDWEVQYDTSFRRALMQQADSFDILNQYRVRHIGAAY